jgi:hypothetical protein
VEGEDAGSNRKKERAKEKFLYIVFLAACFFSK